jgi:hypothetical protein
MTRVTNGPGRELKPRKKIAMAMAAGVLLSMSGISAKIRQREKIEIYKAGICPL